MRHWGKESLGKAFEGNKIAKRLTSKAVSGTRFCARSTGELQPTHLEDEE